MTTKSVILNALALCLVVFALSACSSEDSSEQFLGGGRISFYVSVDDSDESTRGADITTDNIADLGLTGIAYPVSALDSFVNAKPKDYVHNLKVTKGAPLWKADCSWPGKTRNIAFFAYAPYATVSNGISVSTASKAGYPALTYTVPSNSANQPDIVVAQTTNVKGDADIIVPLHFKKHICSKVVVKCGSFGVSPGTISSVKLCNVYTRNTYDYKDGWGTADTKGDVEATTITVSTGESPELITPEAKTFMMVPQTLPSDACFQITYSTGRTYSVLLSDIPDVDVTWEEGNTYYYSVNTLERNFEYTGTMQKFVAPWDGVYSFECWGGSGGDSRDQSILKTNINCRGGYTYGEMHLNKGDELFVSVGPKGDPAKLKAKSGTTWCWGGGGYGSKDKNDDESAGGGGGASDIRLTNGNWDSWAGLCSRIMVAGAGGGGAYVASFTATRIGWGGGLSGGAAGNQKAGTQNTGYAFGKGGNATSIGIWTNNGDVGAGGGGGGYWGGYACTNNNSQVYNRGYFCGAGGSSYISGLTGCISIDATAVSKGSWVQKTTNPTIHYSGKYFSNAKTLNGNENMPNVYTGVNELGHLGNGYVRIKCILPDNQSDIYK